MVVAFVDPQTYAPKRNGVVAVIDTTTDTVTTTIALPTKDPFARLQRVHGTKTLVINLAEDFGGTAGCYATVDTVARTAACVVQNSACGGWSGSLWPRSDGHVWAAAAAGFSADGTLCHFKVDGTVVKTGIAVSGSITDVGVSDAGEVWAVDGKGNGGVWLFNAATDELILNTAIDLGAPPAFASGVVFLP